MSRPFGARRVQILTPSRLNLVTDMKPKANIIRNIDTTSQTYKRACFKLKKINYSEIFTNVIAQCFHSLLAASRKTQGTAEPLWETWEAARPQEPLGQRSATWDAAEVQDKHKSFRGRGTEAKGHSWGPWNSQVLLLNINIWVTPTKNPDISDPFLANAFVSTLLPAFPVFIWKLQMVPLPQHLNRSLPTHCRTTYIKFLTNRRELFLSLGFSRLGCRTSCPGQRSSTL